MFLVECLRSGRHTTWLLNDDKSSSREDNVLFSVDLHVVSGVEAAESVHVVDRHADRWGTIIVFNHGVFWSDRARSYFLPELLFFEGEFIVCELFFVLFAFFVRNVSMFDTILYSLNAFVAVDVRFTNLLFKI